LESHWVRDDDPSLQAHLGQVVAHVRAGHPFLQVIETRRLMAHSKGDDNRPPALIERLWQADPLSRLLRHSESAPAYRETAEEQAQQLADEVAARPLLPYVPTAALPAGPPSVCPAFHAEGGASYGRVAEELNQALHQLMGEHPEVVLLGEDL